MGVEEIYNTEMSKPFAILEIFNEHFGEDKVDMQGFPSLSTVESALPRGATNSQVRMYLRGHCNLFILVHFPQVTITNEHDRSTDIRHLYAKVAFDLEGKIQGRFQLNRADYSMLHITNGYMHSHVSSIPFGNFESFQTPCTGSGPINSTICSLSRDFDPEIWRLFCLELERYVHVESIAGTPYHRLESLVAGGSRAYVVTDNVRGAGFISNNELGNILNKSHLALFTKYLIDKEVLKFHYANGEYCLAMSDVDAMIKVSNCFIDWYNRVYAAGLIRKSKDDLICVNILQTCKLVSGKLMRPQYGVNRSDYRSYIGRKICTFKGHDVTLTISDFGNSEPEENEVLILKPLIINYIVTKILNVLNYRYGNERVRTEGTSGKKVYFL